MRFSTVIPFIFAGLAIATPTPVEREVTRSAADLAVISSVLSDIQTKVGSLGTAVSNFQSSSDIPSLYAAAQTVTDAVNSGNDKIKPLSTLTLSEALKVANQVDALTKVINSAVDTSISKRSTFDAAQASGAVYEVYVDFKSSAQPLITTVVSKVPANAQSIAKSKADQVIAAIQRGIDSYKDAEGQ